MTINNKTVLAIIPARAGSRRIPLKNLQLYAHPKTGLQLSLIEWAIRHAKFSEYIDTICISSDSDEILAHAKPPIIALRRPAHLASDRASSEAVITHALYAATQLGEPLIPFHDIFVLLQPTSPLRTSNDIDSCLEIACHANQFNPTGVSTTVSITPDQKRNGAVYVSETIHFLSHLDLNASKYYEMPFSRSIDIDYQEDFFTRYTTEGSWKLPK